METYPLWYINIHGGDDQWNGSAGEAMTWEKVINERQRGCVVQGALTASFLHSSSQCQPPVHHFKVEIENWSWHSM